MQAALISGAVLMSTANAQAKIKASCPKTRPGSKRLGRVHYGQSLSLTREICERYDHEDKQIEECQKKFKKTKGAILNIRRNRAAGADEITCELTCYAGTQPFVGPSCFPYKGKRPAD